MVHERIDTASELNTSAAAAAVASHVSRDVLLSAN